MGKVIRRRREKNIGKYPLGVDVEESKA